MLRERRPMLGADVAGTYKCSALRRGVSGASSLFRLSKDLEKNGSPRREAGGVKL
jgi:hypothetical protein